MSENHVVNVENGCKVTIDVNCNCDCCGSGGTGDNCPHPSYPFTGKAMADFQKTERCVGVRSGDDSAATVVDVTEEELAESVTDQDRSGNDISISQDGNWMVNSGFFPYNGTIYAPIIFKQENGKWIVHQKIEHAASTLKKGGVGITPNVDWIALLSNSNPIQILLYKKEGNQWLHKQTLTGNNYSGRKPVFSPDGTWLAIPNTKKKNFYKLENDQWVEYPVSDIIQYPVFSPDSKTFACIPSDIRMRPAVYKLESGEWVYKGEPEGIDQIASVLNIQNLQMSHDGERIMGWVYSNAVANTYSAFVTFEKTEGGSGYTYCPEMTVETETKTGNFLVSRTDDRFTLIRDTFWYRYDLVGGDWVKTLEAECLADIQGGNGYGLDLFPDDRLVLTNVIRIYRLTGGAANEIYPYEGYYEAGEIEGFVGVGFTQDALLEGETGRMDVMFD